MRNVRWVFIAVASFIGLNVSWYGLQGIRILLGYDPAAPTPQTLTFVTLLWLGSVMALAGWVVARTARAHRVLHGLLVGVGTMLIYEIVSTLQGLREPVGWLWLAAHVVKILGGAVGGWFAERHLFLRDRR
jgi:putative membrane protein (TIGR04086 family)